RREKQAVALNATAKHLPGWLDYTAIAGAVLAVESGFLWLLLATPLPLESAALRLEQVLRPEASAARLAEDESDHLHVGGNWLWSDQTERPLPKRTNFKPGNRPEIF